jgi:hypothetical protein
MYKIIASTFIILLLNGCATLSETFDARIKQADAQAYGYCALARTVNDNGVLVSGKGGYYCNNSESEVAQGVLQRCEDAYGTKCVITRTYDRYSNRLVNLESTSVEQFNNRKRKEITENLSRQCASFGFQKETQAFAECMLNLNNQNAQIQQQQRALKTQQDAINYQQLQQSLQILNQPKPVSPTITCTKFPGSFTTTCQ